MFFLGRQDKQMRLDIARAGAPLGATGLRSLLFSEPHMHHIRGGVRGARGARGPSGPSGPSGASGPSGPLERFDIASELDGVPQRVDRVTVLSHHPRGARNGKPDVIDLYSEAPVTGGRVLRFKVPFVHTTGGTFFRPAAPTAPMAPSTKKAFASRGDRTRDHVIKSHALYLLS